MGKFWIQFVIREAISVVEAFVAGSKLNAAQKTAAENMITATQAFLGTL